VSAQGFHFRKRKEDFKYKDIADHKIEVLAHNKNESGSNKRRHQREQEGKGAKRKPPGTKPKILYVY